MSKWIPVSSIKPPCKRDPDALGTPVLIWPRNGGLPAQYGCDGFAYYGRRATGRPDFYIHGVPLPKVTHWMPRPKGPRKDRSK